MGPWCAQMGAGGWFLMVLFWLTVVGLALWAVSRLFPAGKDPDPLAVLDSRLAAGELDLPTYRSLRDELGGRASATTGGR